MLTEICAMLRNWFIVPGGRHYGTYKISGGSIAPLPFLKDGQYYLIVGGAFNEGVHRYPDDKLKDEEFTGAVFEMAIPPAFLDIVKEIEDYSKSDGAKPSPYISESYPNGYSYTKATGQNGAAVGWETVFRDRLAPWRKL